MADFESRNNRSGGNRGHRGNSDRRSSGRGDGERRYGHRNDRNGRGGYGNRDSHDGERRYGKRNDRRDYDRRSYGERYDSRDERRSYGDREDRRNGHGKRNENRGERGNQEGQKRYGAKGRSHAQRGGKNRDHNKSGPHRNGYRDERMAKRANEPDLPSDIDVKDLDPLVLQDLRVLSNENADAVAKHLIMVATWLADDPQLALRHARAAKDRAGRVAVVRETAGIAAYHAGEWKEALSELRAARRMSGGPGLIAVMADCERGLGRPEKAIEIGREIDPQELDEETRHELAIVIAGARQDLGQLDSAVTTLDRERPDASKKGVSWARLSYAYADALATAGRIDEARTWFNNADKQDEDGLLDAAERLKELG